MNPHSNRAARKRRNQQGSILVVCMVLAGLGTIGVAAWIALLDARGHQVNANFDSVKRRATLRSSKALARDALYTNHLHQGTGLPTNATYTIPGDPAAVANPVEYKDENVASTTIQSFSEVPLSNAAASRTTKNGVTPFRSYTTDITVQLSDNVTTDTSQFQLRAYNPVLGGELLSMHPSNDFATTDTLISGNVIVNGRAMFWDAAAKDLKGGVRANGYLIPNDIAGTVNLVDTANNTVLPLNYPIPLQTTGFANSTPAYNGELDIVRSSSNSHNDYATRWAGMGTLNTVNGLTASAVGPGPDTVVDGPDDAALEAEIASKQPDELMALLPTYYPLSSRVLNAVVDKNSPPFTADQLYTIFSSHIPIPNDALAYLTVSRAAKISPRGDELNENNETAVLSDGSGKVEIFLDRAALPHLILESAHEIIFHGQQDAIASSAAAAMDPRGIAINNTGTDSIHTVDFRGQNLRRIVLSISTEQNATPPAYGYDAEFAFTGPNPFPEWHMVWELQNTQALIDSSLVNNAIIVGGIRGSRPINAIAGILTINQQTNVDGYEDLLSRNAWVEAYLAP